LGNATSSSDESQILHDRTQSDKNNEFTLQNDFSVKGNNASNVRSYLIDTPRSIKKKNVKYESTPNPEFVMANENLNYISDISDESEYNEPEFFAKIKMDFSLEYDDKKYEVVQKNVGQKQSRIPVPINFGKSNFIARKHFYIYDSSK
jgi:hypothetical protein